MSYRRRYGCLDYHAVDCPCKDCNDRTLTCDSNCLKYKLFKAKIQEARTRQRREVNNRKDGMRPYD